MINMLMHADYFSPAKSRIRIFNDRIEYFNPGRYPKPLKELIKSDLSIPRNPIIAKLFRLVKLAENAGYGFDKMIEGWESYTGKRPDFFEEIDHAVVSFSLKSTQEIAGAKKVVKKSGANTAEEMSEEMSGEISRKY